MHELSLTRDILEVVLQHAQGRIIRKVRLHVGKLAGVEIQALRFCFDVCAAGTYAEGATLVIEEIPGRAVCEGCDKIIELSSLAARCPCERKARLRIESGEELLIKEMETESCA
ncbi:MAG: hydrogenase maturation nickel metallochaperone HypA [Myxococcales bacterium]|nr:hydrogenase maturation nickel metallochaperone HypA [Myxococcales bacterium]